jgi:DNA-binding beta-propeller fold protein YncE
MTRFGLVGLVAVQIACYKVVPPHLYELVPEDASLLHPNTPLAEDHFVRIPAHAFSPHATVADKLRQLLEGLPQGDSRRLLAAVQKAAPKADPAAAPTAAPTAAAPTVAAPKLKLPLAKGKCTGIVKVYMNGKPFHGPSAVDWDSKGNLWVANDVSNSIMKIERSGGALVFGTTGESKGRFNRPLGIAINSHDVVYVTNIMTNCVMRIYPNGQVERVVKGDPVKGPLGIQVDTKNNIYIANAEDNKILKIKYPRGPISLFASSTDSPQVAGPQGLGMDSKDNLFVCNGLNNILKITPSGKISVFAKGGILQSPRAIAVDSKDNIFVTNTVGSAVFRAPPNGTLTVFAQTPANLKARNLWGLQVNANDDLFVADWNNNDLLSIAPPGPPSAPTIGTAQMVIKGSSISAIVSFTPPVHDGGCKIKGYHVTSFPDDITAGCLFSPCTVKGLKPGKNYYFFVIANNFAGESPSSSLSNSIKATAPPTPGMLHPCCTHAAPMLHPVSRLCARAYFCFVWSAHCSPHCNVKSHQFTYCSAGVAPPRSDGRRCDGRRCVQRPGSDSHPRRPGRTSCRWYLKRHDRDPCVCLRRASRNCPYCECNEGRR